MNRRTDLNRLNDAEAAALEARFGLRVAARLGSGAQNLTPDVSERLRFAREQAVAKARHAAGAAAAPVVLGRGQAAVLGDGGWSSWWLRLGSVLPLIVLIAGLVVIHSWTDHEQISALAEVDAELLADDLPPAAYADPGFAEFLRTVSNDSVN